MKLKDIVPYCLEFSTKPFNTSFNPLYFWVIGGFTYTIDSFESYCPPEVFDEHIHLSRYNFCNHDEIQKKYDPDNNYLSLNLNNEITIFDKFIMVHKIRGQTTDSESKLFFKTHYYVANGHDFSSDCYTLGLYHTDALGGMATNLRTVFKDLINPPVQPKPAEFTLDEKVDDLISSLIPEDKINEPVAWVVTSENGVERPTCITEQQAIAVANSLKYHRESLRVVPLYEHPPKTKDNRTMAIKKLKRMLNERL